VDLNEPVTIDNETLFCMTGNFLALQFLAASRDAVILAGAGTPIDVGWHVQETLATMLAHTAKCKLCPLAGQFGPAYRSNSSIKPM